MMMDRGGRRDRRGAVRLAAVCAAAAVIAGPAAARADEAYKQELRDEVSAYFGREKLAARLFLGFGVASIAGGGALISRPDAFPRSAGYVLAGLGVIQAVAATAYHFSIDARVEKLHGRIAADPSAFHAEELERIRGVSNRFVIFRYTEIALMATGIGLAAAGEVKDKALLKGIGLGLAVEAFVLLGLAQLAEHSAHRYAAGLQRITPKNAFVAPVLAPRNDAISGLVFGVGGSL